MLASTRIRSVAVEEHTTVLDMGGSSKAKKKKKKLKGYNKCNECLKVRCGERILAPGFVNTISKNNSYFQGEEKQKEDKHS